MCERISQLLKQLKPEGPLPREKRRHQREPGVLHFTLWGLTQARRQGAGSERPLRGGESKRPLCVPPEAWEAQPGAEFCQEIQELKTQERCAKKRAQYSGPISQFVELFANEAAQGKCPRKPRIKQLESQTFPPSSIFMMLRSGRLEFRALQRSLCRGQPATTNSVAKRKQ